MTTHAVIDSEVLNGLAAKLETLDLTDAEQAALDEIMDRARSYEPEVEGFGFGYRGLRSGSDLLGSAFTLGLSLGVVDSKGTGKGGGGGGGGTGDDGGDSTGNQAN